jgi:hypothetical protein
MLERYLRAAVEDAAPESEGQAEEGVDERHQGMAVAN